MKSDHNLISDGTNTGNPEADLRESPTDFYNSSLLGGNDVEKEASGKTSSFMIGNWWYHVTQWVDERNLTLKVSVDFFFILFHCFCQSGIHTHTSNSTIVIR